MEVSIKFLETVHPIFCGGKNLQQKLDVKKVTGLIIFRRPEENTFIVYYNKEWVEVSQGACAAWVLTNQAEGGYPDVVTNHVHTPVSTVTTAGPAPQRRGTAKTAQVSDPTRGMR